MLVMSADVRVLSDTIIATAVKTVHEGLIDDVWVDKPAWIVLVSVTERISHIGAESHFYPADVPHEYVPYVKVKIVQGYGIRKPRSCFHLVVALLQLWIGNLKREEVKSQTIVANIKKILLRLFLVHDGDIPVPETLNLFLYGCCFLHYLTI